MQQIKKRGISLIVLIVTIIVVIILAAVVVLTLSKNNPINSSKEATFREDIYNFKTELELYKAKISGNGEDVTKLYANKDSDPSITDVISSISKKYIDKLEVREGKLAYVGKDKTEYLLAREINILPEDELLDDDILTELKPFITEWTVEAGDSITLPISGTCNFAVDYGDGTGELKVTSATDEDRVHTYENAGTYVVTINGKCNTFSFITVPVSATKITKVNQFGAINLNNISFSGCTSLKSITEPVKNSFIKLNNGSFAKMFYKCTNLESIPEKLFFNIPNNVTDLSNTFSYCSNIKIIPEKLLIKFPNVTSLADTYGGGTFTGTSITTIPDKLFMHNPKIQRVHGTFSYCTKLVNIPENLFANNSDIVYFGCASGGHGCFKGCDNLKNIPPKLFANNAKASNFTNVFQNCSNIEEIPQGLFDNNINIKELYGTFEGCTSLRRIPNDIFKNNTEVTTFRGCFSGCVNLEYLPEGIFDNCNKVESFYWTFGNCSKMQGEAPKLWERENIDTTKEYNYRCCFSNCKRLSNYNEIPRSWK